MADQEGRLLDPIVGPDRAGKHFLKPSPPLHLPFAGLQLAAAVLGVAISAFCISQTLR